MCRQCDIVALHALIRAGASLADVETELSTNHSVNVRSPCGKSPLMTAAYYCRKDILQLLIDKGAVVNDANDHGITALHGAAHKGANRAVQLLVDRGADLAAKDKGEDFGFGVSSKGNSRRP